MELDELLTVERGWVVFERLRFDGRQLLAAHGDEDSTDDEEHRADPHRVPTTDHERVARCGGEGVAARTELLRYGDRRGRSLVGRSTRRGRKSVQVAVDVAAVAGVERAAEHC